MAYSYHTRIAFGGTLYNGLEIWECTLNVGHDDGSGAPVGALPDPGAFMGAFQAPLKTWFLAAATGIPSNTALAWLKVNNIKPDGTQEDPITHVYDYSPPAAGSGVVSVLPAFLCVAITFKSLKARPPGAWGRIYLPNYGYAVTNGGNISTANATAAADAGAALLNAVKGVGLSAVPCIASKVDGSLHAIQQVSADTVLDVQRRRKNRFVGTRQISTHWP